MASRFSAGFNTSPMREMRVTLQMRPSWMRCIPATVAMYVSGNIGASWSFTDRFVPYVNVATAFETPTTTELVNQPDGSGGIVNRGVHR